MGPSFAISVLVAIIAHGVRGNAAAKQPERERLMPVAISLKHRVPGGLEEATLRVSDPKHADYGRHLSNEGIRSLTEDPEAKSAVEAWALQVVLPSAVSWAAGGDVAFIKTSVADVEALFDVQVARSRGQSGTMRAIGSPKVPTTVAPFVQAVFGLDGGASPLSIQHEAQLSAPGFGEFRHCSMVSENRTGCFNVTPVDISHLYGIGGVEVNRSTWARQAVGALMTLTETTQYMDNDTAPFDNASLAQFFEFGVSGAKPGDDQISAFYPSAQEMVAVYRETMLDVEYIMGLAPGVPTDLWNSPADIREWCHHLVVWTDALLAAPHLAQVVSISYASQSNMSAPLHACDAEKQFAVDTAFMKLAARGVSVLVGSGDSGAGGALVGFPGGESQPLFPSWPASSRWVTAVGATRLTGDLGPEVAVDTFGSGGGFSWDLPAPAWQTAAVAAYFEETSVTHPPQDLYHRGGRATPDVSAIGEGYQTIQKGSIAIEEGTSASTPTFAAMISLLNQARLKHDCPPLGFLNPLLYMHPEAFNDITIGDSRSTPVEGMERIYGWFCTAGWDPVTGLGTPRFSELLHIVLRNCSSSGDADLLV